MTESGKRWYLGGPPYRAAPESSRRIMRTQLALMALPAAAGFMFYGYRALGVMMVAGLAAGAAEWLIQMVRPRNIPGSMAHSLMMGLLVAFMLPADCRWYVAAAGAGIAVVLGKQLFWGLGQYIWHPAVVGRLAVQWIFRGPLGDTLGPLLAKEHIFTGDIKSVTDAGVSWFNVDWFTGAAPAGYEGFKLLRPEEAIRHIWQMKYFDEPTAMSQYMLEKLGSLGHLVAGAAPGGIGEGCTIVLILVGLFLIYRGYLAWQMPVMFIGGVVMGAIILPLMMVVEPASQMMIIWPVRVENAWVGMTYVGYHLLSGGVLLGAMVLMADMTSRPITIRGQMIYGLLAGILTMVLRIYTNFAIPCYVAILLVNSLVPVIDGLTRPRNAAGVELIVDKQ